MVTDPTHGGTPTTWPTGPVERVCRGCQQLFVLAADEVAFYRNLAEQRPAEHWQLPARCRDCRHWKRKARSEPR